MTHERPQQEASAKKERDLTDWNRLRATDKRVICCVIMSSGLRLLRLSREFNSKARPCLRTLLSMIWIPAVTTVCLVLLLNPAPALKPLSVANMCFRSNHNDSGRTAVPVKETSTQKPARHHVFFLKVHKAASTTVQNLLFRFALRYNLTLLLPNWGHYFSEKNKLYSHRVLPLNHTDHYDILCCHLVYNETFVTHYMPSDSLFVAIMREPFAQMSSAFFYYLYVYPKPYLRAVPGPVPFLTYLKNPQKWEHPSANESLTNNRMSFDFGLDPSQFRNTTSIQQLIVDIDKRFDLVMIYELFDESLVLLKRVAGWTFRDIIYFKANSFNRATNYNVTREHRLIHREYGLADYALYEHFLARFKDKVSGAGEDFAQEVSAFRKILSAVWNFCNGPLDGNYSLHFEPTHWSKKFDFVIEECVLMNKGEMAFVQSMKLRHIGLLK